MKYHGRIGRETLPSGKAVYRARTVLRGKVRKFTHKNRALVEEWLEERDRERAGLPPSGRTRRFLVRDAFKRYLDELHQYAHPSTTIAYYKAKFARLAAGFGEDGFLDWVGQQEIDTYIAERLEAAGAGTVLKELTALATVQKRLKIRKEWETPRLLADAYKPRRKRIPTVQAAARLWLRLEPPAKAAMGLCLLAGWRTEETLRATAAWCDFRGRELYLPEEGTKEREPNRTAMVATLAGVLPRSGRLVKASRNQLARMFRRACQAAKVEPEMQGPGIFRHACATWLNELGFGRDDVRLILSHAHGDVTDRYVHGQAIGRKRTMLRKLEVYFLRAVAAAESQKSGTRRVRTVSASARKRPRSRQVSPAGPIN